MGSSRNRGYTQGVLRRRRGLIVLVFAAICVLGLVFSVPSLTLRLAKEKASARGLKADISDVSFELRGGRLHVWFESVTISHPEIPQLWARFPFVEGEVGLSGLRAVVIHGGHLKFSGTRADLFDSLKHFRGKSKPGAGQTGGTRLPLRARGAFVEFAPSSEEAYSLWGLALSRTSHVVSAKVDLAKLHYSGVSVESRGVAAELVVPELSLRSFAADETTARIALDRLDELLGANPKNDDAGGNHPVPASSAEPKQAPAPGTTLAEDGAEDPERSNLRSILSLSPRRGERLTQRLRRLTGVVARRLPESAELDFADVNVRLSYNGAELNVGPGRFKLAQDTDSVFGGFVPETEGMPGVSGVEFSFRSPRVSGPFEIALEGGPISLSELGVRENDFGLTELDRAKLELRSELSLSADGQMVSYQSKGELSRLSLANKRIAPEPLQDLTVSWKGSGELATDGSRLVVRDGSLRFGDVATNVNADILREPERLVLNAAAEIPVASCQSMFDSLPAALVGELSGTKFSGTFSWNSALVFDSDKPKGIKARWRMQNDCRVERVPPEASPERFRVLFKRQVPDVDGEFMHIISGPGSADWVAIPEISRYLEAAITVTEDGAFWSHRGFDQRAIESSIRQNLQNGRFVRGASTISMQLAKNLYLSRDKNVSRKVREALLTMLLEQELRKDEILELYFNVIEFGPGIYGIGPAAQYYFKSDPIDLSISQAFYLASILPNPKAVHFTGEGQLKPGRERYLKRLMKIAHGREKLSDEELEEGLSQSVRFGEPYVPPLPELPGSGIPDAPLPEFQFQ